MIHGHELRGWQEWEGGWVPGGAALKVGNETTVIAQSIKYILKEHNEINNPILQV